MFLIGTHHSTKGKVAIDFDFPRRRGLDLQAASATDQRLAEPGRNPAGSLQMGALGRNLMKKPRSLYRTLSKEPIKLGDLEPGVSQSGSCSSGFCCLSGPHIV